MAFIRPKDLPAAASVTGTDALIIDNGANVKKATPLQLVDAAIPLASQADAETGIDNSMRMSPLRVKQAIDAQLPSIAGAVSDMIDLIDFGTGTFPATTLLGRPVHERVNGTAGTLVRGFDADGFYVNTNPTGRGGSYIVVDAGARVVYQRFEFRIKSGGTHSPEQASLGMIPWTVDITQGAYAVPPTGAHRQFTIYALEVDKILTTNGAITPYANPAYPQGILDYDVTHVAESFIVDGVIYHIVDGQLLATATDPVLDTLVGNFAGFEIFKNNTDDSEPGMRMLSFSTSEVVARQALDRYVANAALAPSSSPSSAHVIEDDFIGGGNTAGNIGSQGWGFTGVQVFGATGVVDHPGIKNIRSPSTAGTIGSFYLSNANNAQTIFLVDIASMAWVFRENEVGVSNHDIRVGLFSDMSTTTPSNGIYLELLTTDTNWFLVTVTAGVPTRTDTGFAGRTNTWMTAIFTKIAFDTIGVSINGGTQAVSATNVPIGGAFLAGIMSVINDTTFRRIDLDYFALSIENTAR